MSAAALSAAPQLQFESEIDENDNALFDNADDIQMLMHDANDEAVDTDCVCPTEADTIAASQFKFLTDQEWIILLLKILDDVVAPDYAFESVVKWTRTAHADDISIYPNGGQSHINTIDVLFKVVANAQCLMPCILCCHRYMVWGGSMELWLQLHYTRTVHY